MTESQSKKIGGRQGLISVAIEFLIAQLVIIYFSITHGSFAMSFFWITDINFLPNILAGILIMLLCGYFYGRIAGKIILIKKHNFVLTGLVAGIVIVLTTALLSGWVGFFQEGISRIGSADDPFEDYIYKPFYLITILGSIPSIVIGVWMGWRIKKSGDTSH